MSCVTCFKLGKEVQCRTACELNLMFQSGERGEQCQTCFHARCDHKSYLCCTGTGQCQCPASQANAWQFDTLTNLCIDCEHPRCAHFNPTQGPNLAHTSWSSPTLQLLTAMPSIGRKRPDSDQTTQNADESLEAVKQHFEVITPLFVQAFQQLERDPVNVRHVFELFGLSTKPRQAPKRQKRHYDYHAEPEQKTQSMWNATVALAADDDLENRVEPAEKQADDPGTVMGDVEPPAEPEDDDPVQVEEVEEVAENESRDEVPAIATRVQKELHIHAIQ